MNVVDFSKLITRGIPVTEENAIKLNKQEDIRNKRNEINSLKDQLQAEDYKVIKMYECSLNGQPSPYDAQKLCEKRSELRQRINELEEELNAGD